MILKFNEFMKIYEDGEGGGVAMATNANVSGMGDVVSPTIGSSPGAVWGEGSGEKGSGDLANIGRRKKKRDIPKSGLGGPYFKSKI